VEKLGNTFKKGGEGGTRKDKEAWRLRKGTPVQKRDLRGGGKGGPKRRMWNSFANLPSETPKIWVGIKLYYRKESRF